MERRDAAAKARYGDAFEEARLGGKLHKAFMSEVGEEVSQTELGHHAKSRYDATTPLHNVKHLHR